jgi:hypothetical protein
MLLVGRTATSLSRPRVHGWRLGWLPGPAWLSRRRRQPGVAVPRAVRGPLPRPGGLADCGCRRPTRRGRALLTARQRQRTSTSAVANHPPTHPPTHPRSERSSRGRRASGAERDHPKRCRFARRRTRRRAVVAGRRFGAGESPHAFGTQFDEAPAVGLSARAPRWGPPCRLTTVCLFHVKRGLRAGHGGAQGSDHECRLESSACRGPGRSADFPDPRELRQPTCADACDPSWRPWSRPPVRSASAANCRLRGRRRPQGRTRIDEGTDRGARLEECDGD